MRRKIVAGNWKMNMTPSQAVALAKELIPLVESENVDVAKVDSKGGVVTGVGSGSCTIHVYAQNGLYKDVVVNVY